MGVRIGFDFVPLPVEIWDDGLELSLSEFRLLGYLIRRQVRFGTAVEGFTLDDLMDGPQRGGKRLDKGCGLSRNSLLKALEGLKKRGWVSVEDSSSHPKLKQLRIKVVVVSQRDSNRQNVTIKGSSQPDSDHHNVTIRSSQRDDPFYKEGEKKEKEKKEGAKAPRKKKTSPSQNPLTPPWLEEHAEGWAAFVAMRDRQRKPLTARATQLLFAKLEKLDPSTTQITAILDQSTVNGWTDVYALKEEFTHGRNSISKVTQTADAVAEAQRILASTRTDSAGSGTTPDRRSGGDAGLSRRETRPAVHRTPLAPIGMRVTSRSNVHSVEALE